MSFIEFLMQYYFYILAVLIVLIVGVIGFLVDSKNKNKNKSELKDTTNSNGGQVINNVDPLMSVPANNGVSSGIVGMQPMSNNLVQNQVQSQIQNNVLTGNGTIDNQNFSEFSNNNILGMEPNITNNNGQGTLNTVNNQAMGINVQANLNGQQVMGDQSMQSMNINDNVSSVGFNNNLGDMAISTSIQPVMPTNNISNSTMSFDSNMNGMQGMQSNIPNVAINPMVNSNTQTPISNNVNQPFNNQAQVSSNDINNIGLINGMSSQPNIPISIPTSPISDGVNQINNQNVNLGTVPNNTLNGLGIENSSMNNSMTQMNGQIYTTNNSQPFDISSMFGNNQQ